MIKFRTLLPLVVLVAGAAILTGCGGDGSYLSRFVIVRANWTDTGDFAGINVDSDDGLSCNSDFCEFGSFSGTSDQEQVSFQARSDGDPYRFLLKNHRASAKIFRVRAWLDSTAFSPSIDGDVVMPANSTYQVLIYRDGRFITTFDPRSHHGVAPSKAAPAAGSGWQLKAK